LGKSREGILFIIVRDLEYENSAWLGFEIDLLGAISLK
jgi:hypothetical protein